MDLDPTVLTAIVGGLATVIVSVLTTLGATRATRQKDRVDMARLVDEKVRAYMEQLEEDVRNARTEARAAHEEAGRLRRAVGALQAYIVRLIEVIRRHDPAAAVEAEAAIPVVPTP